MKHIFVVKKGSLMIWKRLDPDGSTPKLDKFEMDQGEDEKSSFDILIRTKMIIVFD